MSDTARAAKKPVQAPPPPPDLSGIIAAPVDWTVTDAYGRPGGYTVSVEDVGRVLEGGPREVRIQSEKDFSPGTEIRFRLRFQSAKGPAAARITVPLRNAAESNAVVACSLAARAGSEAVTCSLGGANPREPLVRRNYELKWSNRSRGQEQDYRRASANVAPS
jgi:hypothetical protein